MPRPKTKVVPFDNTATEVSPGVWEWVTGNQRWRFAGDTANINTGPVTDLAWHRLVYFNDLKLAAVFSEGFRCAVGLLGSGQSTRDSDVATGVRQVPQPPPPVEDEEL
jgi:hypothetical protein